jgi:flagellar hook-length control protein FliK
MNISASFLDMLSGSKNVSGNKSAKGNTATAAFPEIMKIYEGESSSAQTVNQLSEFGFKPSELENLSGNVLEASNSLLNQLSDFISGFISKSADQIKVSESSQTYPSVTVNKKQISLSQDNLAAFLNGISAQLTINLASEVGLSVKLTKNEKNLLSQASADITKSLTDYLNQNNSLNLTFKNEKQKLAITISSDSDGTGIALTQEQYNLPDIPALTVNNLPTAITNPTDGNTSNAVSVKNVGDLDEATSPTKANTAGKVDGKTYSADITHVLLKDWIYGSDRAVNNITNYSSIQTQPSLNAKTTETGNNAIPITGGTTAAGTTSGNQNASSGDKALSSDKVASSEPDKAQSSADNNSVSIDKLLPNEETIKSNGAYTVSVFPLNREQAPVSESGTAGSGQSLRPIITATLIPNDSGKQLLSNIPKITDTDSRNEQLSAKVVESNLSDRPKLTTFAKVLENRAVIADNNQSPDGTDAKIKTSAESVVVNGKTEYSSSPKEEVLTKLNTMLNELNVGKVIVEKSGILNESGAKKNIEGDTLSISGKIQNQVSPKEDVEPKETNQTGELKNSLAAGKNQSLNETDAKTNGVAANSKTNSEAGNPTSPKVEVEQNVTISADNSKEDATSAGKNKISDGTDAKINSATEKVGTDSKTADATFPKAEVEPKETILTNKSINDTAAGKNKISDGTEAKIDSATENVDTGSKTAGATFPKTEVEQKETIFADKSINDAAAGKNKISDGTEAKINSPTENVDTGSKTAGATFPKTEVEPKETILTDKSINDAAAGKNKISDGSEAKINSATEKVDTGSKTAGATFPKTEVEPKETILADKSIDDEAAGKNKISDGTEAKINSATEKVGTDSKTAGTTSPKAEEVGPKVMMVTDELNDGVAAAGKNQSSNGIDAKTNSIGENVLTNSKLASETSQKAVFKPKMAVLTDESTINPAAEGKNQSLKGADSKISSTDDSLNTNLKGQYSLPIKEVIQTNTDGGLTDSKRVLVAADTTELKTAAKDFKQATQDNTAETLKADSDKESDAKLVVKDVQTKASDDKDLLKQHQSEAFKGDLLQSMNNSGDIEKNKILSTLKNLVEPQKTVNVSEIIKEFSKNIQQGDKQSITYQLTPENLGKVKLVIDLVHNQVNTHIEVENDQVRQFIQSNIEQLKDSLKQSGVQLSNVNISLANYEKGSAKSFAQNKKASGKTARVKASEEPEPEVNRTMGYNTYEFLA